MRDVLHILAVELGSDMGFGCYMDLETGVLKSRLFPWLWTVKSWSKQARR